MKKILALVLTICLAITCMVAVTSCGPKGKLVVGITDYKPMDYKDADGNWIGFDAELAQMFAEEMNLECEFVEITWSKKVAEVNAGEIDLIWNGMTASDELGQEIDFSIKYARNAQVLVAKKGANIDKDNLANLVIAVENGSAGDDTATALTPKQVNRVEAQVDALIEVVSGNSDAAMIDLTMASSVVGKEEYADLEIVEGAEYGNEEFAVGMKKGSEYQAKLNEFFKAKYADNTLQNLAEKYGVVINEAAFN